MKKIILLIIDGLGDHPLDELRGKTPLEAARTPNLDFLASKGLCGLINPYLLPSQDVPKSDTCHLALLGFDPSKYYLGRGVYEAAGVGIKLKEKDVALRVNFGTIDKDFRVIDRRAGRIKNTGGLIKSLGKIKVEGVRFLIEKSYGHRAVLVIKGDNLSPKISDGDPGKPGLAVKNILPEDNSKEARFTAEVLNKFIKEAHLVLKDNISNKKREAKGLLPANYILVRGAGQLKRIENLEEKHGLKACCIAGGALYKGIGAVLGMKLINVEGATGLPDTDLNAKIMAAKRMVKTYDFVFLHIKAADSFAEDGNFLGKKKFIEKIDKSLSPLVSLKNILFAVTGDHSTCCDLKNHCLESMPLLIYGVTNSQKSGIAQFSEKSCSKGSLDRIQSLDLMEKIKRLAAES
ncbi:MAG: 2,3-bisphosphoglycerate-independent phosphoglycerate mutase [Candidatus Parcubacteria bacterium]|nr:2,3-bisphosphoglycerate-independent phosphoglycerate mutase [Candidatus Parcubacteria bacterium]